MDKNTEKHGFSYYKNTIIACLLALLLIVLVCAQASFASARNEMAQVTSRLTEMTQMKAGHIKSFLDETISTCNNIALAMTDIVTYDEATNQFVENVWENSGMHNILLMNQNGDIVSVNHTGYTRYDWNTFDIAMSVDGEIFEVFSEDGINYFSVISPVLINGKVGAFVVSIYNCASIFHELDLSSFNGEGYLHIFTSDGKHIAQSSPVQDFIGVDNVFDAANITFSDGYTDEEFYRLITNNGSGAVHYENMSGQMKYAYLMPIGIMDWYVMMVVPRTTVDHYVEQANRVIIVQSIEFVAIFTLLSVMIFREIRNKQKVLEASAIELKLSDERFRIAASHTATIIYEFDYEKQMGTVSQNKQVGIEDTMHFSFPDYNASFVHPDDEDIYRSFCQKLKEHQDNFTVIMRLKILLDNDYLWYKQVITAIRDENGMPIKAIITMEDIDEQKKNELALRQRAESDPLTGLLNRVESEKQIDTYLLLNNDPAAFVLVDVDDFKHINDHYGHQFGDEVLKTIAMVLNAVFRANDIVGRLGGDEFIIFLKGVDRSVAEWKLGQLTESLEKHIGNLDESITLSLGAVSTNQSRSFSSLYKMADTALYHAKQLGKNQVSFYEDMHGDDDAG